MAPASGSEVLQSAMREKWQNDIPVLYDWIMSHNSLWPSLTCRWGTVVSDQTHFTEQRVYLSEQTDGSVPNTIFISNATIPKPTVTCSNHLNNFEEEFNSPFIQNLKSISHPGEVNRIREFASLEHIIATHSDSANVYIWNVQTQPNQQVVSDGNAKPKPDLVLVGHTDNAEFALSTNSDNFVLSGGKDKNVILWNLEDHISTLQSPTMIQSNSNLNQPIEVQCRGVFKGHENDVEDVSFNFFSKNEFCSVGDDKFLLFFDQRVSNDPVSKVENAHDGDVHCVDWNALDENLVLTGSADCAIKVFDRRNLISATYFFKKHSQPVTCVQWSPYKKSIFGSSGDDGLVNIWDLSSSALSDADIQSQPNDGQNQKVREDQVSNSNFNSEQSNSARGLIFQHIGHRNKVLEFQWNNFSPWTILSTSINEGKLGGGIMQIWRMNEFIWNDDYDMNVETKHALSDSKSNGVS